MNSYNWLLSKCPVCLVTQSALFHRLNTLWFQQFKYLTNFTDLNPYSRQKASVSTPQIPLNNIL